MKITEAARLLFSEKIEEIVVKQDCMVMEAILLRCEDTGLEIETAVKHLTPEIRERIEGEARSLNLLKADLTP